MYKHIAVAALCLVAISFHGYAQKAEPFKPSVPLLEYKQVDGKWQWLHSDKPVTDEKTRLGLIDKLAAHKDEANGWKGPNKDGNSFNPLVIHVDGHAPSAHVISLLKHTLSASMVKVAVGTTQHIKTKPDKAKAPDTAKLGEGYIVADNPVDEGLAATPSVPKERVGLYLNAQDKGQHSYVVSIGARGRKVVEGSLSSADHIVLKAGLTDVERKVVEARRKELVDAVTAALEQYVAAGGAKIEVLEFRHYTPAKDADKSPAWVFFEIAALAMSKVNANRVAAKTPALKLVLPWQYEEVEPPPPEQPPEEGAEFPKDEPPQKNPTEDERIVPDDEGEDDTDTPNNDLAENPNKGDKPKPDLGNKPGGSDARATGPKLTHRKHSPDRANQARVDAALKWLADHQDREGFWSANNFPAASTRKEAPSTGNIEFVKPGEKGADFGWVSVTDIGLTGLGLLAFTANGQTHKEGDYKTTLRSAILHLRKVQTADGCFGTKDEDLFVYNHAIATTAMAEVYAISGDQVLKPILDYSVKFILDAQNPGLGWRYGVKPAQTDSSVTGWMLLALHTASAAGIKVDTTKVHEGAFKWFDTVTVQDGDKRWRTGYDTPGSSNARLRSAADYENNPTMDGIHGAVRLLAGKAEGADAKLADFEKSITENPPKWEHKKLDYYYWFWASMFLQQRSGKARDAWWEAASEVLTKHQRGWHELDTKAERTTAAKLAEHGSWDAVDAWSMAGGRVYATAMGALTLSMPWRFAPPTSKATPEKPEGK